MPGLEDKNVVLGVTGGISAYKAAELCRLLRKANANVRVVMTRAACEFITPLTMQTLSGNPVARELLDITEESEIGHIRLADEADIVVVAPATADAIARLAAGMADDLLAAVVLATRAPVLLAPAMNVNMWENPLTQSNLRRLLETGRFSTVGPDSGELACGWIGAGRLVDPAEIAAAIEVRLTSTEAPLAGRVVVVTAGPTVEALDDVRFLGNRSSGKMGFAMAAAAVELGAEVTLVAGPVNLPTPVGVKRRVDVESALQMQAACKPLLEGADALVMAAAVSDFRPAEKLDGKLSRRTHKAPSVSLVPNPDLLAEWGRTRRGDRPLLVGFAAEIAASADDLVRQARSKLADKKCDVVIANDVGTKGIGFGSDRNAVTLVFREGEPIVLPVATKQALAKSIWARLASLLPTPHGASGLGQPERRGRHLRAT
jgi:phosphopantothenoylcysteine decarboxylase/phosphopantothenate--cysteine ligase